MKTRLVAKAITHNGKRSTLSLEPQFWEALTELIGGDWMEWIREVDQLKGCQSLSSAVRCSLIDKAMLRLIAKGTV